MKVQVSTGERIELSGVLPIRHSLSLSLVCEKLSRDNLLCKDTLSVNILSGTKFFFPHFLACIGGTSPAKEFIPVTVCGIMDFYIYRYSLAFFFILRRA